MKAPNLHLNLLRNQEVVSSSPVRLRVLLPVLGAAACVAVLGWWGMLLAQEMMVRNQIKGIQGELAVRKAQHDEVLKDMAKARDLQAELDQLAMYGRARKTYGAALAHLAEVLPEERAQRIQLLSLEIPEATPQDLTPPGARPGVKLPPLLGPTGTVEKVALRIQGRTEKVEPVNALMEAFATPAFSNLVTIVKSAAPEEMSPRIHSFRQETATGEKGASRLLAFDIEYKCPERRFEK